MICILCGKPVIISTPALGVGWIGDPIHIDDPGDLDTTHWVCEGTPAEECIVAELWPPPDPLGPAIFERLPGTDLNYFEVQHPEWPAYTTILFEEAARALTYRNEMSR